jgi:hypothetical protein
VDKLLVSLGSGVNITMVLDEEEKKVVEFTAENPSEKTLRFESFMPSWKYTLGKNESLEKEQLAERDQPFCEVETIDSKEQMIGWEWRATLGS